MHAQPGDSKTAVGDVFKTFIETIFPFAKGQQQEMEKRMRDVMKKEVARGVITFKPVADKFLHQKLKTMTLDDDFKKKIAEKRKGLAR